MEIEMMSGEMRHFDPTKCLCKIPGERVSARIDPKMVRLNEEIHPFGGLWW